MRAWIASTCLVVAAAGAAFADTGGSMGGGNWSSSSSSGGSYHSSSSGHSSSNSSYSYSSSGGSGSTSGGELVLYVVLFLVVCGVSYVMQANKDPTGDGSLSLGLSTYTPSDSVDVSVLRIAVDGRSRKFVQSELARIAQIADTKTTEGRATMLREVAMLLRRLRDAWVYGGAVNEPMIDINDSKRTFDRHVGNAREKFREETVRNEQGQVTRTAPAAYTPRSDEGAGVILVSIIVAARRELFTVHSIGSGDDLRQALESASQLSPQELVAIEIVWMPSEDSDRLSSIELEARYPQPQLIPITNALVGKTFCAYCGGPYPAELVSCPHCGAPAPGREKQAA